MGKCSECGGKLQLLLPIEGGPINPYGSYKEELPLHCAVNDRPEKPEKKLYHCLECGRLSRLADDRFEASEI